MFEEKQSQLAKVEGISSKVAFENRRSGWGEAENRLVSNAETQITLRRNAQF